MFNQRVIYFIILLTFTLSSMASIEPLCKWYGIAPFCFIGNSCPDNCVYTTANDRGDGATCWIGVKNYCCCPKQALDSIVNTLIDPK